MEGTTMWSLLLLGMLPDERTKREVARKTTIKQYINGLATLFQWAQKMKKKKREEERTNELNERAGLVGALSHNTTKCTMIVHSFNGPNGRMNSAWTIHILPYRVQL